MRADFCSSPTFERHGRPRARHRFIVTATSVTGFPPSPQLPSLRNADAWDCSSTFTRAISPERRCKPSFAICSGIFVALSFFSGMAVPSTGDGRCRISSSVVTDSMSIVSPLMRRNSIRTNSFGQMRNAIYPTVCPRTSKISIDNSENQFVACNILRKNCGRVSTRLSYHGRVDEVPLLI